MSTYALESVARAICVASGLAFGGGVGQGTFKETYLATRSDDGTKLAVKVLKPGCSTERSDREVDAMKRCTHPNTIALLELAEFEHAGVSYVYLVERFMDGGTLDDRLNKGLMNRDEVLALGEQLIRAVSHIADNELVHRDLKPANIMYPAVGAEAVVGDFGLVRDLTKHSITKSYLPRGPATPFFAAPEQLNNEKALIDWRTDQFALAVTLSISHFGVHPYQEDGEDDGQTIDRVASRVGPAAKFGDLVSKANLPVLGRMVAAWPADRFRTPGALLSAWCKQKDED
jgi:serine/threonine protein kinase